jgi:cell division protease FtsH
LAFSLDADNCSLDNNYATYAGGGRRFSWNIFSFGKSKAKLITQSSNRVTFQDVAGADEAKVELQETIEFLKEPTKFQKLGGKIPRGVLLLGPPGTGKTSSRTCCCR